MIQNKKHREHKKTSLIPKEVIENADLQKPGIKQNNDHTRIMRKYNFVAPLNEFNFLILEELQSCILFCSI